MTRDEAIKVFAGKMNNPMAEYFSETVARITPMIDVFVALGMLKLDEPINVGKQFEQELRAYLTSADIQALMNWMEENKIKVARA